MAKRKKTFRPLSIRLEVKDNISGTIILRSSHSYSPVLSLAGAYRRRAAGMLDYARREGAKEPKLRVFLLHERSRGPGAKFSGN